jgi:hypothetical protein
MIQATIRALKQNDEDHQWYPTTDEIIEKVVVDLIALMEEYHGYSANKIKSILDIGAGDGRVLKAIQKGMRERDRHNPELDLYAIEKAIYHLSNMPKDITVIGTDFEQQALADKPVGAIFCNPPYSKFDEWVLKIVREACTRYIYFVIPRRWRDNLDIKRALELRAGEVTSLGEFDFEDADRRARAKVEVIRIEFGYEHEDPFCSVIEDMMPELDVFDIELEQEKDTVDRDVFEASQNLVEVLVESYDRDMMSMLENYKAALRINANILKELGVDKQGVLKSIRLKIKSLKDKYWRTLFDEMGTITQRLATKQREAFLKSLSDKLTIDFTANNVYSILIWVSKWANDFFDQQLIELFKTMSNDSCVVRYKSNQRIWTNADWRYLRDDEPNQPSHYRLEYRMVLSRGGISSSTWDHERQGLNGLSASAFNLLKDLVTVANNLGFASSDSPRNYKWVSNQQNTFLLGDGTPLVAVRAYKNGNMHLHINPKVMLAINVEAGRLLRWIRNPAEACSEMDLQGQEAEQAAKMFGSSFRISPGVGMLRLNNREPA